MNIDKKNYKSLRRMIQETFFKTYQEVNEDSFLEKEEEDEINELVEPEKKPEKK